ncbi:MAG: CBS domain-containing protein [Bacteroidetes bacterium]|nr:CBS domain-containing protein [Bacteroidota bacterium]
MAEYLEEEMQHYLEPIAKKLSDVSFADILSRPIKDLKLIPATLVNEDSPLSETIGIMQNKQFGALLVTHNDQLAGIFTERDILNRLIGATLELDSTPVSAYMTKNPESLMDTDPVVYAMNKMVVGGFRHIPITDKNGKPVSVLSIRDCIAFICSFCDEEVFNLPINPQRDGQAREGA